MMLLPKDITEHKALKALEFFNTILMISKYTVTEVASNVLSATAVSVFVSPMLMHQPIMLH